MIPRTGCKIGLRVRGELPEHPVSPECPVAVLSIIEAPDNKHCRPHVPHPHTRVPVLPEVIIIRMFHHPGPEFQAVPEKGIEFGNRPSPEICVEVLLRAEKSRKPLG